MCNGAVLQSGPWARGLTARLQQLPMPAAQPSSPTASSAAAQQPSHLDPHARIDQQVGGLKVAVRNAAVVHVPADHSSMLERLAHSAQAPMLPP